MPRHEVLKKPIQQVTPAYAPHEQPNAEERTGERRQLSRAATVGQDRRSVFRQVSFAHQWWSRFADDTPTDISCGSSPSPTARTRLFVYWIFIGPRG